ncbi:MAG: cobyrinate a,c-diamide synthase [Anaerolineaceae bacterium]|nr:cobyrinate a,c-diamide synthase [Anaerolineaceae bacterium]
MNIPRILLSAPASGSGKSTIVTALMAAFSQNMPVQGFKVGPDFVDPMYHQAATGRPSINLDSWMLEPDTILKSFQRNCLGSELAIIEGVMGLFDGFGSNPFSGSTAEIARLTSTPVILVLDASKLSSTAAAIIKGLDSFHPHLKLSGVICNKVGSERHAKILREAIQSYTDVVVLGCLPRLTELELPERKLGLLPVGERPQATRQFILTARTIVQKYLDLDKLLAIASQAAVLPAFPSSGTPAVQKTVRIGVAKDEAFCFYYQDDLNTLEEQGVQIVPFSPLRDLHLPENLDGLFFGGGYVELYAQPLSKNVEMLRQIRAWCRQDKPLYTEGASFVYLCEAYHDNEETFPLVSAIPGYCEASPKLTMGYRNVELANDTLLGPAGLMLRGHEFHYSRWIAPEGRSLAYRIENRSASSEISSEGWASGNLLASFIHLPFLQNKILTQSFIARCHSKKGNKPHV